MAVTVRVRTENDVFQHLETLKRKREKRQRGGEFFVEGVRPINLALAHGWAVRALVYAEDRPLSSWARGVLASAEVETHYALPGALFAKLSDKNEPSELLAVVRIPPDDPARIPLAPDLRVVAFDRPASPGNLGTLMRSCDALGVHGLIVTGHAADVYDPETVRASTGSLFALPVVRLHGPRELSAWLDRARAALGPVQLVGTDERAPTEARGHDFRGPTVLALGNEARGLSAAYRERCDSMVCIPMEGSASSLNVACAASIVLYEMDAQRRTLSETS